LTVRRSYPRILKDLVIFPYIAAAAALLLLSGCSSGEASLRQDVTSLRAEIRTLQRENADLARRVEAMGSQLDLLAARSAKSGQPVGGESAAAVPPRPAPAAPASSAVEPLVPTHLKVIKLEQPKAPANPKKTPATASPKSSSSTAPAVPTATPIQDPSALALAALGSGKSTGGASQAAWDSARALTGLSRARALEQFTDAYPAHARAVEALVDAARIRDVAGDPDGSCEDFARAVAEYPAARGLPDAIEGLAACEKRRGRAGEAQRLLARLVTDFPDSPAGKRAREHAPAVQGAAP
jgi:TolA-binding protein